jgi:acyl-homoserine-lactone acylase
VRLYQDLRARLFNDPDRLKADYAASPAWLKDLMAAWADGLNFYLATHPEVHPGAIQRFEPWMALSFSEGSIGGDIEQASLSGLESFYKEPKPRAFAQDPPPGPREPRGSNGIAISPQNTRNAHALLLINPHTSFYFRSELQMSSDAGLNAYGAVTWGQFFIYQGFNDRVGWMHTSTGADTVDRFLETVRNPNGEVQAKAGDRWLPLRTRTTTIAYKGEDGRLQRRVFTLYESRHGPIIAEQDGRWVALALMNKPVAALQQSFLLTKAQTWSAFMQAMALKANSSNNTVYADADGHIAYLHPQFIPRRDDRFDYTKPVDGADPAADWRGLHELSEAPHLLDPATGWIMNTNDWPYSAAGASSPLLSDYPRYMDRVGENPRGVHAAALLRAGRDWTLSSLLAAAYDPYLPAFAELLPTLSAAFDAAPADGLKAQVALLRSWDDRWSAGSTATTLAVFFGDALWRRVEAEARAQSKTVYQAMDASSADVKLAALSEASRTLVAAFGSWRVPWGEVNRFQRLSDDPTPRFDDAAPSLPVPFTSARWGSLASFGTEPRPGLNKLYGASGNSFVAVVEFGPVIKARAISAGGESGDPASKHFNDQAPRYAAGDLRDVYFYPAELKGHTERSYTPGS